jgi:hypothetical protein
MRVAARPNGFERAYDSLELLTTSCAWDRAAMPVASNEAQADGIAACERYPRKGRRHQGRERQLRTPCSRATERHRGRRVHEEQNGAIRLRLELPDDQPVVTKERSAVDPAKVVAGDILAEATEFDARAAPHAPMHTGKNAFRNLSCAQAKRGELSPVDGAPNRTKRSQGIDTSGGSGPPS